MFTASVAAQANAMKLHDPIAQHQLPVIRQIIQDETWLEGERRGCHVSPKDHVVRENVCRVVLRIGQQMRDSFSHLHLSDQN
jgi:hypothetical protein